MPVVSPGECFHLDYGGSIPHFFFVVSAPDLHPTRHVVLVPMTKVSDDKRIDPACVLQPGDHHKCKMPSFIDYRRAVSLAPETVSSLIVDRQAKRCPPPASSALLRRLRDGARRSDMIRGGIQRELADQGVLSL